MAVTSFAKAQPDFLRNWVRDSIRVYREESFFTKFTGKDENNIVQLLTDYVQTKNGDKVMIGLKADLDTNGIVGDNNVNGRHVAIETDWMEVQCDQLRKSVLSKGRVDNQNSVFEFRSEARDSLGGWQAAATDEMLFLAASGVGFDYNTDGSKRVPVDAQDSLADLAYADKVTPPSSKRHFRFDGNNILTGDTTQIAAGHVPSYRAIVDLAAEAASVGMKPLRSGGESYFALCLHPRVFAALKKDAEFRDAVVQVNERGKKHPILTGGVVTIDGLVIHTSRRVFNTLGAPAGQKWGAGGNIDGSRGLLMGCQALALANIFKQAVWYEGKEDQDAKDVISLSLYKGIEKTAFRTTRGEPKQDFGVMAIDFALA